MSSNPAAIATAQRRGLPPRSQGTSPSSVAAAANTKPTERSEGNGAGPSVPKPSWCCSSTGLTGRVVLPIGSPPNGEVGGEPGRESLIRRGRVVIVDVGKVIARIAEIQQPAVIEDRNAFADEGSAHPVEHLELGRVVCLPEDDVEALESDLPCELPFALSQNFRGELIVPLGVAGWELDA